MLKLFAAAVAALCAINSALANDDDPWSDETFKGLSWRSIGPAFMSGRIADIALDPGDPNRWYVAVGSGGVWKTENAGTTWTPLFDDENVYSIGCVALDPQNPSVVWVGTGENVGGRHVGFGDGIYRSRDGGHSWQNLGLAESEHISEIIVHPNDSNVVWVAVQGPLWTSGGERGVYRTEDGGQTWTRTLGDDQWTGATDLSLDPRDPNVLYAATWQRHRTVAAYVGGGPGSGIHKSTDGGVTWRELTEGLPEGDMGKIGLAQSPLRPDVLYAAIELDRRQGAVYRSENGGEAWVKGADAVAGGTGPHYYQELYASPHHFDRIYLAGVRFQISDDGGRTFRELSEEHKHSDNHALVFRADDPDYLLAGSDGGLYESFDDARNWRFIANLPITQYYKVAVDDAEPFYNVYGGTQDNNTQGGPSRTDNVHGIRNADWFVTLFGDGHQPATEPGNPDIVYSEWQQGNLVRHDRTTGEIVYIKPQSDADDPPERFNWDAPILVSPHSPTRLYFASQRVWRSDDRGDSWQAISQDLTRDEDRVLLPLMGRQQSWDAAWDMFAMSNYNTITSLTESPKLEGLLYAGTDDGLIAVSENGGTSWRTTEVSRLPGVPERAFVNDIKADLFDADTAYVALDNHKYGDFKPYLLKTSNRGRSWTNIADGLPDDHLVWRIVQDHVRPSLLFAATEFGVFATVDGGDRWFELQGGMPTISVRDLAIQRRENDLIAATFGRSFYVLDDYSPLRDLSAETLSRDAQLFAPRDADWYVPRELLGGSEKASQGASYFVAPNPPFGAIFSYYLKDDLKSLAEQRQAREKPRREAGDDTPYLGWEAVEDERREADPAVLLIVRDADGNVVRRISEPGKRGFHRIAWDLRFPPPDAIGLPQLIEEPDDEDPVGHLVTPGEYSATLHKVQGGTTAQIGGPVTFQVKRMRTGALPGSDPAESAEFWSAIAALQRQVTAANTYVLETAQHLERLQTALSRSRAPDGELAVQLQALRDDVDALSVRLTGSPSAPAIGRLDKPSVNNRLQAALVGTENSTYGPTPNLRKTLTIATEEFAGIRSQIDAIRTTRLPELEQALLNAGAPWTSGLPIPD